MHIRNRKEKQPFMNEKEQLYRLRRENKALKKRIHALEKDKSLSLPDVESNGSCYNANNYFSYLFARMREKSFYAAVRKYLKPSLWATRIFRIGVILYQYLQAGAFVLLYTAAFILIVPILLSVMALTLILTLVLRKHNTENLLKLAKEDVVFIIPDGKDGFDDEYIRRKCSEFEEKTVLVVSPFFLSKKGIGPKEKMYVCYRKEAENVYILRNYFFFYFRKRIQKTYLHKTEEIYLYKNKEV